MILFNRKWETKRNVIEAIEIVLWNTNRNWGSSLFVFRARVFGCLTLCIRSSDSVALDSLNWLERESHHDAMDCVFHWVFREWRVSGRKEVDRWAPKRNPVRTGSPRGKISNAPIPHWFCFLPETIFRIETIHFFRQYHPKAIAFPSLLTLQHTKR